LEPLHINAPCITEEQLMQYAKKWRRLKKETLPAVSTDTDMIREYKSRVNAIPSEEPPLMKTEIVALGILLHLHKNLIPRTWKNYCAACEGEGYLFHFDTAMECIRELNDVIPVAKMSTIAIGGGLKRMFDEIEVSKAIRCTSCGTTNCAAPLNCICKYNRFQFLKSSLLSSFSPDLDLAHITNPPATPLEVHFVARFIFHNKDDIPCPMYALLPINLDYAEYVTKTTYTGGIKEID
jgi:hypothetical protein